MTDPVWLPKKDPWLPPDYDDLTIYAVRALAKGEAAPHQQKRFWEYVMYLTKASEAYADLSFRPGEQGVRATDFAEGAKSVGLNLRKLLRPELNPKGSANPVAVSENPAKPVHAPPRKRKGRR